MRVLILGVVLLLSACGWSSKPPPGHEMPYCCGDETGPADAESTEN